MCMFRARLDTLSSRRSVRETDFDVDEIALFSFHRVVHWLLAIAFAVILDGPVVFLFM